jgi:hypothetical protein
MALSMKPKERTTNERILDVVGGGLAPAAAVSPRAQPSTLMRPFDPAVNTPRDMGLGGPSTEYLLTVERGDGTYRNIPSIWWNGAGEPIHATDKMSELMADRYERETGETFPVFGSIDDAVNAAKERSARGGATHTPLATPQRSKR